MIKEDIKRVRRRNRLNKRRAFSRKFKRLVGFVDDVLKYGPALPFVLIGAGCNQICKLVVGGFVLGWEMNRDSN